MHRTRGENPLTEALPRTGTLENPIIVNGAGDEQYAGCTGFPADSHQVNWLTVCQSKYRFGNYKRYQN